MENVLFSIMVAVLFSLVISTCKLAGGMFVTGSGLTFLMVFAIVSAVAALIFKIDKK